MFDKVRQIFLGRDGLEDIKESPDTNDKKLLIHVPYTYVHHLAGLIEEVEQAVQQAQIDIEMNSLEDAFIKIAETDIRKEEKKIKDLANQELFMSEEDEQKAMQEYFAFEGRQSCCQKVTFVFVHRMQNYYRSTYQWVANLLPLAFITILTFVLYSIMKASKPAPEIDPDTGEDFNANYESEIIPMVIKYEFAAINIIAFAITGGMSAMLPLKEKEGGLRHMMRLTGLSSLQYWLGMFLADFVIALIPTTIASVILLFFDTIMARELVIEFFVDFQLFIAAVNCFSYLFSHAFSDPDTAIKNLSLIYIFGMFMGPFFITLIVNLFMQMETFFASAMTFWYFISPFFTFLVFTINVCTRDVPMLRENAFKIADEYEVDLKLSAAVYVYQIIIIFIIVVLIDHCVANRYKKPDSHMDGEMPPHLEVHEDVKEHEEFVRKSGGAGYNEDHKDYLQIKAIDLCKTYPKAPRMSVCRNTFGVKKGEVFGLLGPNGAGKSTTFGMMAMQFPITSG